MASKGKGQMIYEYNIYSSIEDVKYAGDASDLHIV